LRIQKDEQEVNAMRIAVEIAQKALLKPFKKCGWDDGTGSGR
jgi:Xaa-Pro aminopeptidase